MGDIFKNKFFIIFLIVACVLTIVTMGLTLAGYGNLVSDVANTVIRPFQTFANMIQNSVSGFIGYFTMFNELVEENAMLREREQELEAEISLLREKRAENEFLRGFFELKRERPDFQLQDASIIAGSAGNYIFEFTINRGSFHGVEVDMPVIASGPGGESIVGFVSNVGVMTSRVSPFMRPSNSVGAYIKRTGDTGMVEGDFELGRAGLSRFAPLSREADMQLGDRIYSSGYGMIYPQGLFIGTIIEVVNNPLMQAQHAYIEPGVDFDQLRDMMIILEFGWDFY